MAMWINWAFKFLHVTHAAIYTRRMLKPNGSLFNMKTSSRGSFTETNVLVLVWLCTSIGGGKVHEVRRFARLSIRLIGVHMGL